MSEITIAIIDENSCGSSPCMPYIGERFEASVFTRCAKLYAMAALLRCGFNAADCNPSGDGDMQDCAMRTSRISADAAIVISYGAFGSGRTFNDVSGFCVELPTVRTGRRSRTLCEDIFVALGRGQNGLKGSLSACGEFFGATCPVAVVDAGYVTNFDDARLVYDPDFAIDVAERITRGVCEFFGVPYVIRYDISAYPMLCLARRDKNVKMLQCLLDANGAELMTDGVYGAETDRAVKNFCVDNGKPAGGVTSAVWRDLLLAAPQDTGFGSRCAIVRYIQCKLRSKLYPVAVTGIFDKATLDALNAFLADTVGGEAALARDFGVSEDVVRLLKPIGGGRPRLF